MSALSGSHTTPLIVILILLFTQEPIEVPAPIATTGAMVTSRFTGLEKPCRICCLTLA